MITVLLKTFQGCPFYNPFRKSYSNLKINKIPFWPSLLSGFLYALPIYAKMIKLIKAHREISISEYIVSFGSTLFISFMIFLILNEIMILTYYLIFKNNFKIKNSLWNCANRVFSITMPYQWLFLFIFPMFGIIPLNAFAALLVLLIFSFTKITAVYFGIKNEFLMQYPNIYDQVNPTDTNVPSNVSVDQLPFINCILGALVALDIFFVWYSMFNGAL